MGCNGYLFLANVFDPADEGEVEAHTEAVLEEEGRSTAVQLPFGDDGDPVAEEIGFVHVMCREDHCTTLKRNGATSV